MQVDLSKIWGVENEKISFSLTKALEENELEFSGEVITIIKPIQVFGSAVNYDDEIHLGLNIKTKAKRICSRCLCAYDEPIDIKANLTFSKDGQDTEDNVYFIREYTIDITNIIIDEITAQLSMKPLCNEYCKGLCQICGVNRNHTSCKCKKTEIDPRLEALSKFFEEK